jgi:hypothetical protein
MISTPRKMPSSGMLCRVDILKTDISEERSASIIRVTKIGELRKLAVTNNVLRLMVTVTLLLLRRLL